MMATEGNAQREGERAADGEGARSNHGRRSFGRHVTARSALGSGLWLATPETRDQRPQHYLTCRCSQSLSGLMSVITATTRSSAFRVESTDGGNCLPACTSFMR